MFTVVEAGIPPGLTPVVTVAEHEGLTPVVRLEEADAAGLAYDYVAAWVTLRVHSSLSAVTAHRVRQLAIAARTSSSLILA